MDLNALESISFDNNIQISTGARAANSLANVLISPVTFLRGRSVTVIKEESEVKFKVENKHYNVAKTLVYGFFSIILAIPSAIVGGAVKLITLKAFKDLQGYYTAAEQNEKVEKTFKKMKIEPEPSKDDDIRLMTDAENARWEEIDKIMAAEKQKELNRYGADTEPPPPDPHPFNFDR